MFFTVHWYNVYTDITLNETACVTENTWVNFKAQYTENMCNETVCILILRRIYLNFNNRPKKTQKKPDSIS